MKSKTTENLKKWPKIVWAIWLIISILILGSIVRNIRKIGLIRSKIETERKLVTKMESENQKLQEKILATQKVDFLEYEARNKLGLIREGETMVILPNEEVLQKLAPKAPIEEMAEIDPNWKQWLKLFASN